LTYTVRPDEPRDIDAIAKLTEAAFSEVERSSKTEQFIVNALRQAGQLSVSLVAEQGGSVVGHVAASPVEVSTGAAGWFGLGPISVGPAQQGRGIGSALMREALARLKQLGARGCMLLGDPAFYKRFGFARSAVLTLPGVPPEYFQALSFGDDFRLAKSATTTLSAQRAELQRRNTKFACRMAPGPTPGLPQRPRNGALSRKMTRALSVFAPFSLSLQRLTSGCEDCQRLPEFCERCQRMTKVVG